MALSIAAQKLGLWLERYRKTAEEYNQHLQLYPHSIHDQRFYGTLQELLGGEFYVVLFNGFNDNEYLQNNIYKISTQGELLSSESLGSFEGTNYSQAFYVAEENTIYLYMLDGGVQWLVTLNLETQAYSANPTTGYTPTSGETVMVERKFIGDGFSDMYDNGNYINTNLTNIWLTIKQNGINQKGDYRYNSIPYTNDADSFNLIIAAGDNYFGEGSTYSTLKLSKLWMLAAKDCLITEFNISGDVGADSGGETSVYDTVIDRFKVYFKTIYGAGDPAIHHIILVNDSSATDIRREYSSNTNNDDDRIYNLVAPTEIYYFLLAGANGNPLSNESLLSITNDLINLFNSDLETTLTAITNNIGDILTSYDTLLVDFSDSGSLEVSINSNPPVEARSGILIPNNGFALLSQEGIVFSLSKQGEMQPIFPVWGLRCFFFIDNSQLYGIDYDWNVVYMNEPGNYTIIAPLTISNLENEFKLIDVISITGRGNSVYMNIFYLDLVLDYPITAFGSLNINTGVLTILNNNIPPLLLVQQ